VRARDGFEARESIIRVVIGYDWRYCCFVVLGVAGKTLTIAPLLAIS
jgi:hypothetical protein